MDDQLKSNLTSSEHWTRFIYMLLFAVFLYIASILAAVLVAAQFVFALITGSPNIRLREFGGETATYINQVWLFLTYNSEEKAYPFSDWPTQSLELNTAQAAQVDTTASTPVEEVDASPAADYDASSDQEFDGADNDRDGEPRKPEKMDS